MDKHYTDAPEVKQIAQAAFPDYKGRSFSVLPFRGGMDLSSYWSGGSRDYYNVINLTTLRSAEIPQGGSGHGDAPYRISTLPDNMAVVKRTYFQGKDLGITIFVNPENLSKMLPSPDEVSWAEKVVLSATRSYKSSYAGAKDYRFQEALRYTGITKQEWDAAKQSLIQKGMLNKAGAITNSGRNAIGRVDLSQLKRDKKTEPEKLPEPEKGDEALPVEIHEKSQECWKCPHCKQEIHEKHSYPVDPYDVECNEEIHMDCGGKFKRPPMDEETKNWLKNFLRY